MDALKITLKDLRLLLRDRRTLVVLIVLPMLVIAIVGSSTGQMRLSRERRNTAVTVEFVDFSQSKTSQRLAGFLASYQKMVIRRIETQQRDLQSLESWKTNPPTDNHDARIVIGPEFESILAGMTSVQMTSPESGPLKDGLKGIDVVVLQNESAEPMTDAVIRLSLRIALQDAMLPLAAQKIPVFRGAARRKENPPAAWEDTREQAEPDEAVANRVYQFVVPSYTVLFVFFLVNIMGRSFIAERELGTLRRLRISPITPTAILIGKTVPFMIISLLQTGILLGSGRILFGMSWGAYPWMLLPVVVCSSLTATTLGLLFSTIAKTDSQVSSMGSLIVLTTAGISGCLVPRQWMPELSRKISLITPHAWALDAYSELLTKDVPAMQTVVQCCGVLCGFAAVFFVAGLLRFRTESQ